MGNEHDLGASEDASEQPRTVLLAGASGYIGRAVHDELIRRGHRVIALYRTEPAPVAERHQRSEIRTADITDPDTLREALTGDTIDAVVSCIASRSGAPNDADAIDDQANRNVLAVARDAGANHFVLLSAICVQKPRLAFQYAKLRFEAHLQSSGIDYTIVRPTAFFKSLSGQIARVRDGKPFLVFGRGTETACKPISESDLAHFIVDCLSQPDRRNQVLPIGGPGPALTPLDQGQLLFELTGQPVAFKHISPALFRWLGALLKPFAGWLPAAARRAEFLRIGHYYATESMLVWDADNDSYDATGTPEFGGDTLREHYAQALSDDQFDDALGEHKLF